MKTLRIVLLPVAVIGLACIWVYVAATMGPAKANEVAWDILDL